MRALRAPAAGGRVFSHSWWFSRGSHLLVNVHRTFNVSCHLVSSLRAFLFVLGAPTGPWCNRQNIFTFSRTCSLDGALGRVSRWVLRATETVQNVAKKTSTYALKIVAGGESAVFSFEQRVTSLLSLNRSRGPCLFFQLSAELALLNCPSGRPAWSESMNWDSPL